MASRWNGSPGPTSTIPHVRRIESVGRHRLRIWFTDGAVGEHDFEPMVARPGPMVEPLRDPAYFARVFVEWGAPTWPNGFDISPEALHEDMKQAGELTGEDAPA